MGDDGEVVSVPFLSMSHCHEVKLWMLPVAGQEGTGDTLVGFNLHKVSEHNKCISEGEKNLCVCPSRGVTHNVDS